MSRASKLVSAEIHALRCSSLILDAPPQTLTPQSLHLPINIINQWDGVLDGEGVSLVWNAIREREEGGKAVTSHLLCHDTGGSGRKFLITL